MTQPPENKNTYSLSVIVIVKDEADRIATCLDSVYPIAQEIIVLDSGSTDQSVSIARCYTDKVYETDWPGYGIQKQRALEKARGEWVLSIDADEALSTELRAEIDATLRSNPDAVGYKLRWGVTLYGQTLKFGRSARAPLRLFQRKGASFSDAVVHEKVVPPPGKIRKLKGHLLHYTHRDFGHALYKNANYAWLGAQQKYRQNQNGAGLIGATLRGILEFVQVYIIRGGFLDGSTGFLMAVMYSQVTFNKYAGLWALKREKMNRDDNTAPNGPDIEKPPGQ
ncbi:MAG: glycosyltransferase family 2 protein [Desulfovermiculus sp.]|nr:glycosyltransferase family 2 protein [Desulfovermiculus sp.]